MQEDRKEFPEVEFILKNAEKHVFYAMKTSRNFQKNIDKTLKI